MSENVKAFYEKFQQDMGKMKQLNGDAVGAFGNMFSKVMGEGSMTVKEKEMTALGIALGIQCEPCILLHVQKALAAGVTKEQIMEVCGVAVMMAGGPAYTHIPMVIDALEACGQ